MEKLKPITTPVNVPKVPRPDRYILFIFEDVLEEDLGCDTCRACKHFTETPDAFATGDSPTELECGALAEDCPIVKDVIDDMARRMK